MVLVDVLIVRGNVELFFLIVVVVEPKDGGDDGGSGSNDICDPHVAGTLITQLLKEIGTVNER